MDSHGRLQVDVAFFTAPAAAAKKPQSSTKAPKTQSKIRPPVAMIATVPDTLLTPRELKSGGKGGNTAVPSPDAAPSSSHTANPGEKPNLKRPAPTEEGDDTEAVSAGVSNGAPVQSRPPPKKRPKAAPTLFIPKNKVSRMTMLSP